MKKGTATSKPANPKTKAAAASVPAGPNTMAEAVALFKAAHPQEEAKEPA